ncbi:hypothetical protein ACNKHP_14865 [Shigella boydii]
MPAFLTCGVSLEDADYSLVGCVELLIPADRTVCTIARQPPQADQNLPA